MTGDAKAMVQKTVLDNGVRLVSQRLPGSFSTTLGVWVQVGSRDETPAQGGVSHFIEHMAFKGTEQRNALDIARQIDRLGAWPMPSPAASTPASTPAPCPSTWPT